MIQVGDDIIFFSPTTFTTSSCRKALPERLLLDNKRRDIYLYMSYEQEEVSLAFIIPSSLRLLIIAITNDVLPPLLRPSPFYRNGEFDIIPLSLCRLDRTYWRRGSICIS